MRFINSIKRETKIIAVSVILLTLSTLGLSYSAIFEIKSNTTNQVIETGSLSVVYGSSSSAINDLEMLPMSDVEGLANESSSTIYIQNNSSLNSAFTITISYDNNSFTSRGDYSVDDELIPFEYLKMAVFEYSAGMGSMVQVSSVINLGDVPIYKLGSSYENNAYAVFNDTVDKSSSGNNSKTYAIKIWIDEDAPDEASGYFVFLNINVEAEVKEAVMNYNINGVIKNSSGTVLNGAVIELQNSSFKATTISNGTFTLNNIREGSYALKITHNNNVYTSNLIVIESTTKSIQKTNDTYTSVAGDTLSKIVDKLGTTFIKFMDLNNIDTDTMSYEVPVGTTYNVPNTFTLVGADIVSLGTLNINLAASKTVATMSLT